MSVEGLLQGYEEYNRVIWKVARETDAVLIEGELEIPGGTTSTFMTRFTSRIRATKPWPAGPCDPSWDLSGPCGWLPRPSSVGFRRQGPVEPRREAKGHGAMPDPWPVSPGGFGATRGNVRLAQARRAIVPGVGGR